MALTPERLEEILRDPDIHDDGFGGPFVDVDAGNDSLRLDGSWNLNAFTNAVVRAVLE